MKLGALLAIVSLVFASAGSPPTPAASSEVSSPRDTAVVARKVPLRLADLTLDRAFWTVLPSVPPAIPFPGSTDPNALWAVQVHVPSEFGLAVTTLAGIHPNVPHPVWLRVIVDGCPYYSRPIGGIYAGANLGSNDRFNMGASETAPITFDPPLVVPPGSQVMLEITRTTVNSVPYLYDFFGPERDVTIGGWKLLPGEF